MRSFNITHINEPLPPSGEARNNFDAVNPNSLSHQTMHQNGLSPVNSQSSLEDDATPPVHSVLLQPARQSVLQPEAFEPQSTPDGTNVSTEL